jgi:hypothetical protein
MDERERAEYIIEVLKPCLKKSRSPDWSTYRYRTAWGTKTEEGLVEVIKRILVSSSAGLPKLE